MKKAVVLITLVFALTACAKQAPSTDTSAAAPTATAPAAPATTTETAAPSTAGTPAPIAVSDASIPAEGLAMWLRADKGVTATQDGAVSAWNSPNNVAATQEDAKSQPKLVASSIGGKPAIRFDGNDSLLETNLDINPGVTPNLTVISVFDSRTAEADPLRKLYGADDGDFDRAAGLDSRADTTNYGIFGGNGVIAYFSLEQDQPTITVDSWTPNTFDGWVNGKHALSQVAVSNEKGLPHMFIGGTGTSFHEPWMGDVAEMLVYTRTLTDQERTEIEDSLAEKYSIAIDHTPAPTTE